MRRVPDIRGLEDLGRQPADGDRDASSGQLVKERRCGLDLGSRRPAVRCLAAGMRRYDVPKQHVVRDAELREHAMDDRRRRLGGTGAGQLAFGRERNPADPRSAVAGRLPDEDDLRAGARREMGVETIAQERRMRVLVVRLADLGFGQSRDEVRVGGYSHSMVAGGFDVTSSTTRLTPGISFTIRAEIVSTRSYGSRAQSAVIASSLVTARITIG